jgi:hypothetical protein
VHTVEPFRLVQAWPHVPQFVVVLRGVSQPFAGFPSQSPKAPRHVGTQVVPLHAFVPCAFVHVWPHAPQFAGVLSWVSQPLSRLVSQSPQPPLQDGTQAPVEPLQLVVPLALLQAWPQVPQLIVVVRSVSQPLS